MKLWYWLRKRYYVAIAVLLFVLVFANESPAPPGFPPPPSASAGGDIAQASVAGAVIAYGVWRLRKKK